VSAQDPTKPVWPTQFDAGFGLNAPAGPSYENINPIINSSAHFYYNWDINSTLIDYQQNCIPDLDLLWTNSSDYPCKLYFNTFGTFFSQPALGVDCCFLIPVVGSIPPDFLADFNYSMPMIAQNWLGTPFNTNFWVGPGGFQYWTQTNQYGSDIQFCDGGSLLWNWGPFNVVAQDPSIFDLPTEFCILKPCLLDEQFTNIKSDLFIRMSRLLNRL